MADGNSSILVLILVCLLKRVWGFSQAPGCQRVCILKLKVLDRSLCLSQVYASNATSEYQTFVNEVNDALLQRLLPNVRIYAYAQKKYGYSYKKYAYTYKILTLVGLFCIAFYRTCVFTHAFFYAWQRIKYGHGMRIFQAFIKKFFALWRHKVA